MLGNISQSTLGIGALILTLALGVTQVEAESACKGLEQEPCQQDDGCSWINPYERKDGIKVAGYCRSKPKRSTSSDDGDKSETE